ncbi:MAG: RNA pseudouridine synthase [Cytophagales bacterium]|nr:MAG: RNA pseudouridine synthase [Cytophagales bacterium]
MKKIIFEDLILFENEDYILVNKPPFFSSLHDRSPEGRSNMLALARQYIDSAQLCHRLDRETSGVLAIAKNPEAYRHLSIQFEKREVAKIYHAIVNGIHDFDYISVNYPILALPTGFVKIDIQQGKEALTFFKTLQAYNHHTLVECRPLTGRMHQIRIHLAVLKAPIIADEQYGGKPIFLSEIKRKKFNLKKDTEEQPLISRIALHARALQFKLLNGEEVAIEAPYPKDLSALLRQLEKFSS